jgi:hypothetical protein
MRQVPEAAYSEAFRAFLRPFNRYILNFALRYFQQLNCIIRYCEHPEDDKDLSEYKRAF